VAIARIELRSGADLNSLHTALLEAKVPDGAIERLDGAVIAPFRPAGSGPARDRLEQLIIELHLPVSADAIEPAVVASPELNALLEKIAALIVNHPGPTTAMASGRALDQSGNEVLRVLLVNESLATSMKQDRLILLETNIDDMNPQFLEIAIERIFQAGALDVWTSAIAMKKGRPATCIQALADADRRDAIVSLLIENTTTLGVRVTEVDRFSVPRLFETVTTRWGDIRIKLKIWHGRVLDIAPEYDDCAVIARTRDVALSEVWSEARNLGQVFIGRRASGDERPRLQLLDPLGAMPERD
jgi:uncharacterized protein (DUF111 family)